MLLAALATVVIATCYDGNTCTTTTGERVRLACIDTPELRGKRAEPIPAKAARDHLRGLVVGKKVESVGSPKTDTGNPLQSCSLGRSTCSKRWSPLIMQRSFGGTQVNVLGPKGSDDKMWNNNSSERIPSVYLQTSSHKLTPNSQPLLSI